MNAFPVLARNGDQMTVSVRGKNDQLEPLESILRERILTAVKLMAHDIQGSLVSMAAMIQLMRRRFDSQKDEAIANCLDELLSKAAGLMGITEEYLLQTLSLGGDLEVEMHELDLLGDVIKPVLEELSAELKSYQIQIRPPLSADSSSRIFVQGDRIWLKAAFRNLLRNAFKYGDKEGTIELEFEDQGLQRRVKLFNTGKPIPEKYRAQLFSPFMQMGKENENGSIGLGLYMVKKIIEKHGGSLCYEPRENGSNFIFTLPRGEKRPADRRA
jgi:signal transduction histidine kinase